MRHLSLGGGPPGLRPRAPRAPPLAPVQPHPAAPALAAPLRCEHRKRITGIGGSLMDRTDLFGRAGGAAAGGRAGRDRRRRDGRRLRAPGLPRGRGVLEGLPPYQKLGLSFVDAANPAHFDQDPQFGWGFYGHRTNLYRTTVPHPGFRSSSGGRGVLACLPSRSRPTSTASSRRRGSTRTGSSRSTARSTTCSARPRAPRRSGRTARPSTSTSRPCGRGRSRAARTAARVAAQHPHVRGLVLARRPDRAQRERFDEFLEEVRGRRLFVVELGAGTAIPDHPRDLGAARPRNAFVVRVNPREPDIAAPHLSIASGALEGLEGIEKAL